MWLLLLLEQPDWGWSPNTRWRICEADKLDREQRECRLLGLGMEEIVNLSHLPQLMMRTPGLLPLHRLMMRTPGLLLRLPLQQSLIALFRVMLLDRERQNQARNQLIQMVLLSVPVLHQALFNSLARGIVGSYLSHLSHHLCPLLISMRMRTGT